MTLITVSNFTVFQNKNAPDFQNKDELT
uniref:Uncharacterized protein n=1 Tax=Nelumbo nucifera TaxID=4432 RepID=A0A822YYA6_NELNU|nr:TPA_asm: hypothetical protein HUJ06_008283 [Nelumbo nucifera]